MIRFDWDETKNDINARKHDITFNDAKLVFNDPLHLIVQDRHVHGEERWQAIGTIFGITVVVVAHTVSYSANQEVIRIISARKATKQEKYAYEHYRE